jgi:hypothetical protein
MHFVCSFENTAKHGKQSFNVCKLQNLPYTLFDSFTLATNQLVAPVYKRKANVFDSDQVQWPFKAKPFSFCLTILDALFSLSNAYNFLSIINYPYNNEVYSFHPGGRIKINSARCIFRRFIRSKYTFLNSTFTYLAAAGYLNKLI